MLIGIDDTDSIAGMCTTYIAKELCRKLDVIGFPRLIRLNPNIPYKTRGNGAIALNVKAGGNKEEIKKIVLETVEKHAFFEDEKTNPGVVFLDKDNFGDYNLYTEVLRVFYMKAVSELVTIGEALDVANQVNAGVHRFKNGRGIIGALAAVGSDLSSDRTYEIIAYRKPENYGTDRKIDVKSVFEMNKKTYPKTFNNVDSDLKTILVLPRGDDPIFCGIRGETPDIVKKAWKIIKPLEEIEDTLIFETNQGTDAHLREKKIQELMPYDCVIVRGTVSECPKNLHGGHVIFKLKHYSQEIECAAYEETGKFREIVRKLRVGDRVIAYGGIGKYWGINLEKLKILELKKYFEKENPTCGKCKIKMKSEGKNKGFQCRKCKKKTPEDSAVIKEIDRELKKGFYEVTADARRHLSAPLSRIKRRGEF